MASSPASLETPWLPTLLLASLAGACSAPVDAPRPLNVVMIVVDDLGWMDSAAYGSTFYDTPHIDRLASEGARFTQFYT
ncbi:MAG: sulfatase-like hydrolase/transferase, partial [Gemmatimonadetes bacterium]|nr:sulfatase-like hydrolase/transferase [Gemmatimonadota bacterium]